MNDKIAKKTELVLRIC